MFSLENNVQDSANSKLNNALFVGTMEKTKTIYIYIDLEAITCNHNKDMKLDKNFDDTCQVCKYSKLEE